MSKYTIYFLVNVLSIISPMLKTHGLKLQECNCLCPDHTFRSVCEHLNDIKLEVDVNTEELKKWAQFFPFVEHLRNQWKEEIVSIVETEMKKYVVSGELLPKPEGLVVRTEEEMMNDSYMISKHSETDEVLVKNVSSLLAKMEVVENRTIEVEEELKSERRVRRHLEEDLKETQSSLVSLGDQLQNVTMPVDTIMHHVQMVIFSSLEDMNKTIHEDHLQKLYYKVDGVVYQNETRKLGERLEHVETELHDAGNVSVVTKLAEDVKLLEENLLVINTSIGADLAPRLMLLETNKDVSAELEEKLEEVLNSTEQLKAGFVDIWTDVQDFRSFQNKLQNFTEEWANSLENLHTQIEILSNRTFENPHDGSRNEIDDVFIFNNGTEGADAFENIVGNITTNAAFTSEEDFSVTDITTQDIDNDTEVALVIEGNTTEPFTEFEYNFEDVVIANSSDATEGSEESIVNDAPCKGPFLDDPELLADIETDVSGKRSLNFGCRTIGRFVLTSVPIPVMCQNGSWTGPFPSCHELANESTIQGIADQVKRNHPCLGRSGDFPDPSDCSRFFKCSHGVTTVVKCPDNLHFNPFLKICDYPHVSKCSPREVKIVQDLKDLIPPIIIDPRHLDRPNSLLGTGTSGQLVVHPRSSFTLHCLYPENGWGVPSWNVTAIQSNRELNFVLEEGRNRISLSVTAAKEADSGTYRCVSPFGKENAIRVEVKAIRCPKIVLDEEYEDVYYRPTPEGEQRILTATAEFQCEGGGRVSVVCMANGNWSRGVPDPEDCVLKKRQVDWNCRPLEPSSDPNLIFERNDIEKIVVFKCAGRMRLIGNSFTRCRDDGFWSHMALPKCIN